MRPAVPNPKELRRRIRAQRRALGPARQHAAARRAAHHTCRHILFRNARRIALYVAADGELDPLPIAAEALRTGKAVYLPVLDPHSHNRLLFVRLRAGARMRRNRFGIPEPLWWRERAKPWQLDLVLMPLVAFDNAGNRLGMGGGFYDRTFARELSQRWPRRPALCGLAHRLQRVDAGQLEPAPWDVPLARVFTD